MPVSRQWWARSFYSLILSSALLLLVLDLFAPFLPHHPPNPEGAGARYALALWLVLFAGPFVLQLHRYGFDLAYTKAVLILDLSCGLILLLAFVGLGYLRPGLLSPRVSVLLSALLTALFPLRNHLLHFHRALDPHAPSISLATLLILGLANAVSSHAAVPLLALLYLALPHHWRVQAAA